MKSGYAPGAVVTKIPVPPVTVAPVPPLMTSAPRRSADLAPADNGGVTGPTVQTGGLGEWLKFLFSKKAA